MVLGFFHQRFKPLQTMLSNDYLIIEKESFYISFSESNYREDELIESLSFYIDIETFWFLVITNQIKHQILILLKSVKTLNEC